MIAKSPQSQKNCFAKALYVYVQCAEIGGYVKLQQNNDLGHIEMSRVPHLPRATVFHPCYKPSWMFLYVLLLFVLFVS